jgi:hypothetical protein
VVKCRQLPTVAVRAGRAMFRQPKGERRKPVIKALNQIGVNGDRDCKRCVAASLQSVGLAGAEQDQRAFCQGVDAGGQMMPHGAVLHPEHLGEVVCVQGLGPCRRQQGKGHMDAGPERQNVTICQNALRHRIKLALFFAPVRSL